MTVIKNSEALDLPAAFAAATLYRLFWLASWLAMAYMYPYFTLWVKRDTEPSSLRAFAAANLLLGWTVVGWVVMLLLAKKDRKQE